MRRRRLARLAVLDNVSPSNSVSPPITPISQSPIGTSQTQSPPSTPIDDKCFAEVNKRANDDDKEATYEQAKCDGVFQVPSKPIDMPSSSKNRTRAPPQRSDSETSSIHMEVDEVSGCADKAGANTDIDSGFENMEVSRVLKALCRPRSTRRGEIILNRGRPGDKADFAVSEC
jgi:hypothetical protein